MHRQVGDLVSALAPSLGLHGHHVPLTLTEGTSVQGHAATGGITLVGPLDPSERRTRGVIVHELVHARQHLNRGHTVPDQTAAEAEAAGIANALQEGRPLWVPRHALADGHVARDGDASGVAPATAPAESSWLDNLSPAAIRARALNAFRDIARRTPGYDLLCVVIGKDLITDAVVPRTAAALINGFLGLIPGSGPLRQNLRDSGALDRAGAWLDTEVARLNLTWDSIKALFRTAWDRIGLSDLVHPENAFRQIASVFTEPISRLVTFSVNAAKKMLEFVFEAALSMAGAAGAAVMAIIRRAGATFDRIMADPVAFAGNLVAAVRSGLSRFVTNIGAHLRDGLIAWLTGSLGAVITIPQRFDLPGILRMVLGVLGLTWQRVRSRLARLVPERVIAAVERTAGILMDLQQRGLAAITDRIGQFVSGLVDTVVGGIREWVTNTVVGAAITRLISMFNPAGAVIQAIIAVYNTIQFFIERAQQLAALANAVFDSVEAIAAGSIANAAQAVENALGRAVPVFLGFLARLIGLGDIATPVRNVIQRVQAVVESAIDRVLGWIAGVVRRAGEVLGLVAAPGAAAAGTAAPPGAAGAAAAAAGGVDELIDVPGDPHHIRDDGPDGALMLHSDHPIRLDRDPVIGTTIQRIEQLRAARRRGGSQDQTEERSLMAQVRARLRGFADAGLYYAPGRSAPGIGTIELHGAQDQRVRVTSSEVTHILSTESEHIIPFAVGQTLWTSMLREGARARSDLRERDHGQTTVVMYFDASRLKTAGSATGVDLGAAARSFARTMNRVGTDLDAIAAARETPEGAEVRAASALEQAANERLDPIGRDGAQRAKAAVRAENALFEVRNGETAPLSNGERRGEAGAPRPTNAEIDDAMTQQKANLVEMLLASFTSRRRR